ncbi:MAG: hypothetical protein WHS63_08460 [Tenuifilum sp.]
MHAIPFPKSTTETLHRNINAWQREIAVKQSKGLNVPRDASALLSMTNTKNL